MCVVFYVDSVAHDAAAAALLSMYKYATVVSVTPEEAKDNTRMKEIYHNTCQKKPLGYYFVVLIGDYWEESTIEYMSQSSYLEIYHHNRGLGEYRQIKNVVRTFGVKDNLGVASFALSYLEVNIEPLLLTMLTNFNKEIIKFVDESSLGKVDYQTVRFFEYLIPIKEPDNLTKFIKIFTGVYPYDKIVTDSYNLSVKACPPHTIQIISNSGYPYSPLDHRL
jgi:hypothetical protein